MTSQISGRVVSAAVTTLTAVLYQHMQTGEPKSTNNKQLPLHPIFYFCTLDIQDQDLPWTNIYSKF